MNTNTKASFNAVIQFIGILVLILGGMALTTWLLYRGDENLLKKVGGGVLVILGVLILIFGDKKLNVKGGIVLKIFDPPNYPARLVKWFVGLVLIFLAAGLLFK